jgi:hypothetical protein
MQDRPTAAELLATLTEYLEGEVLPNVDGTLRYHTLVAANITRMLRREAELYPAASARERRALQRVLAESGGPAGDENPIGDAPTLEPPAGEAGDEPPAPTGDELLSLNAELARRLRAGEGDHAFERACWEVLHDATRDKLAISKPGYDSYDMAQEVRAPASASPATAQPERGH